MPSATHSPVDADARIAGSLDFEPMTRQPSTVPPRAPRPLLLEWALAGSATMTACLFTNPSEVIKTRMQLQGELMAAASRTGGPPPPRLYTNVFAAFGQVARTEGLRGLQGGLGPSLLYQLTMNGTRLGLYEPMKRLVVRVAGDESDARAPRLGDHARAHRPPVFWHNVVAAAASGCIAAFIGSPFFLVKVRLQVQNKAIAPLVAATVAAAQPAAVAAGAASAIPAAVLLPQALPSGAPLAVGAQHAYTSALGGLRSIYAADGVPGLFRGATASMVRVMIGGTVQLTTYDSMKFAVMQRTGWHDSVKVHVAASSLSGFLVTVAMNPADVISTRLYNQPVVAGRGQLYSGLVDCAVKTVRAEGVKGLYKGFAAHYLRIGPHTLLTFIFWEQIKAAAAKAGF